MAILPVGCRSNAHRSAALLVCFISTGMNAERDDPLLAENTVSTQSAYTLKFVRRPICENQHKSNPTSFVSCRMVSSSWGGTFAECVPGALLFY